jgi:hypothetical protein
MSRIKRRFIITFSNIELKKEMLTADAKIRNEMKE